MIRPAVILRKISQSNRSEKGAAVQAVLMSIYRTLKLRSHDPLATITSALRTYLTDGQLHAGDPGCVFNSKHWDRLVEEGVAVDLDADRPAEDFELTPTRHGPG